MCIEPRRRRQRGVTLIELVLFIVVISVALLGVLQVMNLTAGASADPLRRKQALMIAEGLLEEVELAKFTYCDPSSDNATEAPDSASCSIAESFGQGGNGEPVGARPYDNVNDYVAAAGVATAAFNNGAVLTDANGVAMNVDGYSVLLTIRPQALGDIAASGASADVDALRITVEVSYDNQKIVLDGYRTRYAPNAP
jgi:MSHA pilin protein MshD